MPISKYDYLVDTYIGIKLDPASYLSMHSMYDVFIEEILFRTSPQRHDT